MTTRALELLEYPLGSGARAFSTTRCGMEGTGNYAGFNLTHYCGDAPEHVRRNRAALCTALGITDERLILPRQTHGDTVRRVATGREPLQGVDALITNEKGFCIGVSTADCVPVLLYDEDNAACGAVHAGWRGTVARITAKAVEAMRQAFATSPSRLRAVIGPSISQAAFEVGDEVYDAFQEAAFPMDRMARRMNGKWHIDLWAANFQLLESAGLPLENIFVCGICTYEHSDRFFSARRLGINSGRIFNGILLR